MSLPALSTGYLLKLNDDYLYYKSLPLVRLKLKKIVLVNSTYFSKVCSLLGLNTHSWKIPNLPIILSYNSLFLKDFLRRLRISQLEIDNYKNSYWSYLQNNKFYKGLRYLKGLPVKGQRTHTNSKTARKLNGK